MGRVGSPRTPPARLAAFVLAALVALAWSSPAPGQSHAALAREYTQFANASRFDDAERVARQGYQLAAAQRDTPRLATWSFLLGNLYTQTARYRQAVPYLEQAVDLFGRTEGARSLKLATALQALAAAHVELSRP